MGFCFQAETLLFLPDHPRAPLLRRDKLFFPLSLPWGPWSRPAVSAHREMGEQERKEAKIEAIPKSRFFPHGICLVEIFGSSSTSLQGFSGTSEFVDAIQAHIGHVRADHVVTHRSRSVQIVTDQYFGMAAPSSPSATAVRSGICDAYTIIHSSTY